MENKNTILKVVTITIVVASIVAIVVFTQAMWGGPTYGWVMGNNWGGMMGGSARGMPMGGMMGWGSGNYPAGWGSEANWWGGMMGGCPMMGWWGGIANVNDSNVGEYVKQRTGYDVISIEKYSNGYYLIIGVGEKPQYEILVFPNGFIHPEPQSMMWYGAPMRITEEEARSIAERWLAKYFPGAEIEEAYVFPGYYTFHFKIGGDMQMLSVNGYNGAVWFHSWHGKYLGEVEH
ncbi:hypothetical protein [Pyrobaculum aerophilum]|uniref:Peptidase M4 n=1 Tax=Pyrobaculum aerophilum TaxID=13773 RepID=A0A371R5D8_9CREN|nr:hypothetical protein [Pyrobaculum aerophilum]RFA93043.1 hypothetical protein CGL51_13635 [Pyrobaculum aerophilum]RFA99302.1 hypothetical protein CGL52_03745 [Pyrobaculum aerophilum]